MLVNVTILTVAERAGVAPSTVSRVMTGRGRVSPDTRRRVMRVAQELGYQPSAAARALITGRTASLGLIVPNITNPFFPAVIKGAQSRARALNYSVFLADADEDPVLERELVRQMAHQNDAVIINPTPSPTVVRDVTEYRQHASVVLLNRRVPGLPSVTVDWTAGLRQGIDHLHTLGHRKLAYLAGHTASWANQERQRVLRVEADRMGMELLVLGPYATGYEGGAAAADVVLASPATAVIAFNDLMALGLLSVLAERRVPVPERLSVVGVDDIQMSNLAFPPLTTVRAPTHLLGQRAVDLCLRLLEPRVGAAPSSAGAPADAASGDQLTDGPEEWAVPTEIVVRRSTGWASTITR